MADETNKPDATDPLTVAASDAVDSQEQHVSDDTVSDETQQTIPETKAEGLADDGLPTDHKERSDLGRKVSAMHRRQDDVDSKLDKMLRLIESQQTPAEEPDDDYDTPLTKKETLALIKEQKDQEIKLEKSYQEGYVSTLATLTRDLDEEEYGAVMAEMQTMKYDPSIDPKRDAELNVYKAMAVAAKKKLSGSSKTNPIKGDAPRSELGTATNNKVTTKNSALPKLDAAGQSYLNFVAEEDGDEKASALHKSMTK